jgi:hypothetical protein
MWTTGLARRVAWYAFAGLFTLGVLVGSGGVLFSYLAYTSRTGGAAGPLAEQRRWDPAMSPILGHWRMAGERLAAVRAWQPPDVYMTHGYFWIESLGAGPLPRWTDGTGQLELREPGEELDLTVAYQEYRAPWLHPAEVTIFAASNGRPATVTTETETRGDRRVLLSVIEGFERSSPLTVEIRSDTWVPAEAGVGTDRRSLGILVQRIQAELDGRRLRVGSDLLPPLPVSEAKPWSSEAFFWFVLPQTQLLDIWWWHLYFSGLPRIALLLAIPPAWGLLCTGRLLLRALTREPGCEPE